jgi:two-component sensor histidine kinase
MVAASFLIVAGLRQIGGSYGFFILFPAIFFGAIVFNRGTGFYVVALEAIGLYLLMRTPGSLMPRGHFLAILLFVIVASGLAWVSESLRRAWQRAVEAERAKTLLLEELGHRTKNNLAMVVSILSLQLRAASNPDVQGALQNALLRVRAISAAHEHVERGKAAERTDMRDYLEELCHQLADSLRGLRPIAIIPEIERIEMPTAQAVPVGLIVNELVINALKYAFPDENSGTVRVKLERGSSYTLTVEDNGIGCEKAASHSSTGSRLVQLLVEQLQGSLSRKSCEPGCAVMVAIP